ncbi:MAG: hypothetical protein ACFFCH_08600 [Promethearchaeota archaeon]
MSFESMEGEMIQMPATILTQLGLVAPSVLAPSIKLSNFIPTERVVLVNLDNFGLLEVVLHKPQFLLKEARVLLTLETKNGFATNVIHELIHGNQADGFNLFSFLIHQGKTAVLIDRENQRESAGQATFHTADTDMRTYIETAKLLNRSDFLYIHFLDFDTLYKDHTSRPPLELAQKLLHRTDRWLLGFYKQARANTLFLILGNQGQRDYGLKYEGKYQDWAAANVPICLVIYKPTGE